MAGGDGGAWRGTRATARPRSLCCGEAARLHGYERAIRLAEAYLPTDLAYTSSALLANASVAAGIALMV